MFVFNKMFVNSVCNILKYGENRKYEKMRELVKHYTLSNASILSYFQYFSLYSLKKNKGNMEMSQDFIDIINRIYLNSFKGTMTLTFGEVAESHVGMQKIGNKGERGFNYNELVNVQKYFTRLGYTTELICLNYFLHEGANADGAYLLVVRKGVEALGVDPKFLLTEMLLFEWDDKFYNARRKIVQNKLARQNLNFSDTLQEKDFPAGKGTTIPWSWVPILSDLRKHLPKAGNLKCEGNMYQSVDKKGIGYHGDTERKKVIGVRLGKSMNMNYMWYYNDVPTGYNIELTLNHGDIYYMSEKAVGTDWRHRNKYVLRHAAGAPSYTKTTTNPLKSDKVNIRNQKQSMKYPSVRMGEIYFRRGGGDFALVK